MWQEITQEEFQQARFEKNLVSFQTTLPTVSEIQDDYSVAGSTEAQYRQNLQFSCSGGHVVMRLKYFVFAPLPT